MHDMQAQHKIIYNLQLADKFFKMELQIKEKTTKTHKPGKQCSNMTLTGLPIEMIEHILSYVSYDQVAKLRLVNRLFNSICSEKLNKGFTHVEQLHSRCLKAVKAKLPRRESERKNHPLARHSDILMSVETRLNMLSMTFTKYIEAGHCCFIPGKVLDEALKVLHIVSRSCANQSGPKPLSPGHILPRPHEFLQEYRDISSMAIEHFDEKILPAIREQIKISKINSQLQCYRARQGLRLARKAKLDSLSEQVACSRSAINLEPTDETSQHLTPASSSFTQLARTVFNTKKKCNRTQKLVEVLHTKVNSSSSHVNRQCAAFTRKLNQQAVMIKHLHMELRKTRLAMNNMSKELEGYKCAKRTALKGQSGSDNPASSNFSVQEAFSLSILAEGGNETPTSKRRGVKRKKLDMPENDNDFT